MRRSKITIRRCHYKDDIYYLRAGQRVVACDLTSESQEVKTEFK